jgi:hypothetical protein
MLINIPVKFHDSRSNTFRVTCDTKVNGRTEGRTRVNLNARHKNTTKVCAAYGQKQHILLPTYAKIHEHMQYISLFICLLSHVFFNFFSLVLHGTNIVDAIWELSSCTSERRPQVPLNALFQAQKGT